MMAKKSAKKPVPKYLSKLLYLQKVGAIPRTAGIHQVDILHDSWCRHWERPGQCDCKPIIKLAWSQPAAGAN
jgi:hypothetical protein